MVNVEHRENDWLVSLSWEERADIYAAGEDSSERALAVVADRAAVDIDELHSPVIRTNGDGMEVVVRRRR